MKSCQGKFVMVILFVLMGVVFVFVMKKSDGKWSLFDNADNESYEKFDDTRLTNWSEGFEVVEIESDIDSSLQKAYFYKSHSTVPRPLIVSLHTWSGTYNQSDELAELCKQKDLNYIHPDFRGANLSISSCCSELALGDIDDAISYAITKSNVDTTRIYVIGVSGGGYATLSVFMKSKHNIKKFSAWASIADLVTWYNENRDKDNNYSKNILDCTGSKNELNIESAVIRSPMFWETPTNKLQYSKLSIYAGIHDGNQGSVPITHSINFFNKLLKELGEADSTKYVSREEVSKMLQHRQPLGDFGSIDGRKICLLKMVNNLQLVIFDGNHEMLTEYALDELLRD